MVRQAHQQMATATAINPQAAQRFALACVTAGCPRDQVENFSRAGYVPTPKQLLFHAAAREADWTGGPDQIGYGGARGPGKSHCIFAQLTLDDCQRAPGLKALYIRKIGKQAREQLDDLRRKVLLYLEHSYNRHQGIVTFPNGSRVYVGHFQHEKDIDSYLGIEYDVIAIEETTTLTELKYRTLRDSNRTSRHDWRPRIYNSTNPGGLGHQWYKRRFILPWKSGREGYTRFIPGTVDDNPHIDGGYTRRLEENTGWRLQAYRYGDWDIAAGQFFVTWNEAVHVIDPFPTPAGVHRAWCAMDYGYNHPTSVHLFIWHEGLIYVADEYVARQELVKQNADDIHAMLARHNLTVWDLEGFYAGPDVFAKRKGEDLTVAEEYEQNNITLLPANNNRISGAARVATMLGDVERGIDPQVFIMRRCPRLIETIPVLEHDPNRPEDVLKIDIDEDGNGGDDTYDSFRYGLMSFGANQATTGRSLNANYRG